MGTAAGAAFQAEDFEGDFFGSNFNRTFVVGVPGQAAGVSAGAGENGKGKTVDQSVVRRLRDYFVFFC